MTYAATFYDSAFVDWDSFIGLGINQYAADWSPEIDKVSIPPGENAVPLLSTGNGLCALRFAFTASHFLLGLLHPKG